MSISVWWRFTRTDYKIYCTLYWHGERNDPSRYAALTWNHWEERSSALSIWSVARGTCLLCLLERIISSIWILTSDMEGRLSGYWAVQSMASCRRLTMSSSTVGSRWSSRSKTSELHSSRTIDRTHLGKSTPSSLRRAWVGVLPVSSSKSSTPKL